jgi:hypothetical protein
MIQEVSNHLFEQFTKNLQQQLRQEEGSGTAGAAQPESPAEPLKAGSLVLSALTRPVSRLFRRDSEGSDSP